MGSSKINCWAMQIDSVYDEFAGRTVVDLGCGTVSPHFTFFKPIHCQVHFTASICDIGSSALDNSLRRFSCSVVRFLLAMPDPILVQAGNAGHWSGIAG